MQVQLSPGKRTSRWGHSMATVITPSGLEAIIMFGGSSDKFGSDWKTPKFSRLAETKIYYFGQWFLFCVLELMHDNYYVFINRES